MKTTAVTSKFPTLVADPSLVYADNASTTQRPLAVIQAVSNFEMSGVANTHRGLYAQAESATRKYEATRRQTARFINAQSENCIAFTKGTTESINAIAFGYLKHQLNENDEVLVTAMEHHANFIPWQQVCLEKKAVLKIIPVDPTGELVLDLVPLLINSKTKLLAVTHISNTLGTINPIEEIIAIAHKKNVPVLIDAAQSVAHSRIDARRWNADFIAFSSHKMFGPFGVGVLYAHPKHHENMRPLNFGGGAIRNVSAERTEWLDFPRNIEAGTSNVSGVIGFSAALDFCLSLDWQEVSKHVELLGLNLREGISRLEGFSIVGDAKEKSGIISFIHDQIHPHDIASFLASKNIAVRAGHHCTQPLLDSLGLAATVRASFSIYNTNEEVGRIIEALKDLNDFWS